MIGDTNEGGTIKHGNIFFLKEIALHWFENYEKEINSWDTSRALFKDTFGRPECRS